MGEEWNGEGGDGGAGEGGKAEEHGPTHEHLQAWRLGLATSRRASFRLGHPTVTPKLPTIFCLGTRLLGGLRARGEWEGEGGGQKGGRERGGRGGRRAEESRLRGR